MGAETEKSMVISHVVLHAKCQVYGNAYYLLSVPSFANFGDRVTQVEFGGNDAIDVLQAAGHDFRIYSIVLGNGQLVVCW